MSAISQNEAKTLAKRLKGIETTKDKVAEMVSHGKSVEELEDEPRLRVEIHADTEDIIPYLNLYHYLTTFLELTDKSMAVQQKFERVLSKKDYMLQAMEDFTGRRAANTYNRDTLLDGVLQYVTFTVADDAPEPCRRKTDLHDHDMVLLQVHGGGDVRGNYSKPQCFELRDVDYFILAQQDLDARCTGCGNTWWSDCSGYCWYSNGSSSEGKPFEFKETDDNDYGSDEVVCPDCGELVEFWCHLDY